MGNLGDMNVKIGADLSDLLSKVDAAKAKLNQLTESQQQLKVGINDLNTSLKLNEAELAKTAGALTKMVDSGRGATAEANKLRTAIAGLSTNSLQLNKSLAVAKTALADTTVQLKSQAVAMKAAETSSGGFAKSATKLYSGLRTIANIIPGIGIGGLVALIAGPVVDAFEDWFDSISKVNKAQGALNLALAEASGSVGGEVANLQSLVNIAKDTSLSYDTRTQAVKELNKEYPTLNGNLTVENANTAIITDAINKQIDAIKRRAEAKAVEKLIDEASIKLEKARLGQAEEQGLSLKTAFASLKDDLGSLSSALGAPGLIGTDNSFHEAFVDPIIEAQKQIDLLSKKLQELNTDAAKAKTLFTPPPPPKGKVEKVAKEVAREYTETLQHALQEFFDKGFQAIPDPFKDLKKSSLGKISPTEGLAQGVKDQIAAIALSNAAVAKLQEQLDKTADFTANILSPAFDTMFKNIATGSENAFQAFGNALKQIIVQLAETIASAAALAAIFAFIFPGSTLGKKGFSALFGKFLGFAEGGEVKGGGTGTSDSILARLSKGEYVIKADRVAQIGVKNLDMINRGGGPPSFDAFLGGKIPKFASGGFISSSMANNLISGSIGGGQSIQVYGRIEARGDKLVTIIDRAMKQIKRNG